MKRNIPIFITFITGLALILAHFVPRERQSISQIGEIVQDWAMIIFAFAIILGALNLLRVNIIEKVLRLAKGYGYSIVLVVAFFVTTGLGIGQGIEEGTKFFLIYKFIFTPLSATMFSLLAFFIASASFRAFRAKTGEATLLLVAAFIVMLGRVPIGDFLWTHIPFVSKYFMLSDISAWIMGFPNVAGQRAILIGAGLGAVAISLKILLGVERSYLGGED